MAERSWILAAKGIPLVAGARLVSVETGTILGYALEADPQHPLWIGRSDGALGDAAVLDLSHPRTQRGYLGDLAIALGAPSKAVEQGAMFYRIHPSCWGLQAGRNWARTFTRDEFTGAFPRNRVLALALAWPEHKRVRS